MRYIKSIIFILLLLPLTEACSTQKKLKNLKEKSLSAGLYLPNEKKLPELVQQSEKKRDTLKVQDLDGKELLIMRAIKDDETGEMVANEVLDAAVVTARFRNVAERRGEVEIEFQITVSDSLQDSRWQLRFNPEMYIQSDTVNLDPDIITGEEFRKMQTRGYQQYERFLQSIARDSLYFIDYAQLEIFLERNIPQIFQFKTDTSFVSDEEFASAFGVTEKQAIDHYTNKLLKRANARKVKKKGKMWERYVRNPIHKEGIRLDTVLKTENGQFIYNYIQLIHTRPKLKKVEIVLKGEIFDAKTRLYTIPPSPPLAFYISSLSSFVDETERYKMKVIERRAEANTACNVDFSSGKSNINLQLGNNAQEIKRIKGTLASLLENTTYDLDSIVVSASCSPDGSVQINSRLAQQRSESVTAYFQKFIRHYTDSLDREKGFSVDEEGRIVHAEATPEIRLLAHSVPEDWESLQQLVEQDTVLTKKEKDSFERHLRRRDLDNREYALKKEAYYPHLLKKLYPRLRTVRFDFHLHRKGMVKDTIHTTVLDTNYMNGVQAIRDRDYELAINILRPYNDYNTAIAYVAMDYNASARAILESLDKTAQINYMLALLYSRDGQDQKAVQCYLHSCEQDPSYKHRGNLDPEISALIKRYNLNAQPEEDEFEYSF